ANCAREAWSRKLGIHDLLTRGSLGSLRYCRSLCRRCCLMTQPTYAAARLAADRIHRHLTSHSTTAQLPSAQVATLPDSATLAALIDAAFWTSLRREEGYIPRISLAFVPPGQVSDAVAL